MTAKFFLMQFFFLIAKSFHKFIINKVGRSFISENLSINHKIPGKLACLQYLIPGQADNTSMFAKNAIPGTDPESFRTFRDRYTGLSAQILGRPNSKLCPYRYPNSLNCESNTRGEKT